MNQQHDPIGSLELLSTALVHAVEHDHLDELLALLSERERVIASIISMEAMTPSDVDRVAEVAKSDEVLAEMIEVEQQKVEQNLVQLFQNKKKGQAYKRTA